VYYRTTLDYLPLGTPADQRPIVVFGYANELLGRKARSIAPGASVSCFIVPKNSGYSLEILSRDQLSAREEEEIKGCVAEVLSDAEKELNEWEKMKKEPNQSPEPTSGLRPAAAHL
jgi:hypothetical protein